MDRLTFGTDGWRDIIGDRFTFDNVSRVAQAYADYLLGQETPKVVVGYDTRFNGALFAQRAAEVLAANGLVVYLSVNYLPTPALSFAVKHLAAGGGVMLTASHNPPQWLGFKLKGGYGGTATQDIYQTISSSVQHITLSDVKIYDRAKHEIQKLDIQEDYFEAVERMIDVNTLRTFKGSIAHEAMGGSGTAWLSAFLKRHTIDVYDVHPEPSALFYGVNPEPIPSNLSTAMTLSKSGDIDAIFVTDGDADRLGVVLPGGIFFNSHQIFTILLDYLAKRGLQGMVVKTFTVSRVIERLATRRGFKVIETRVGFKYIVDAMLTHDVLIGGEESGGIGVKGHLPERDAILNSLLLIEAMATSGKALSELFHDIEKEVGWEHAFDRLDLQVTGNILKDAVMTHLTNPPETFADRQVISVETLDGVKLNLSDHAWVMFRPSGTEPVLRVYCEAASTREVEEILRKAADFVLSHSHD